jgi:hypothetical protein
MNSWVDHHLPDDLMSMLVSIPMKFHNTKIPIIWPKDHRTKTISLVVSLRFWPYSLFVAVSQNGLYHLISPNIGYEWL